MRFGVFGGEAGNTGGQRDRVSLEIAQSALHSSRKDSPSLKNPSSLKINRNFLACNS